MAQLFCTKPCDLWLRRRHKERQVRAFLPHRRLCSEIWFKLYRVNTIDSIAFRRFSTNRSQNNFIFAKKRKHTKRRSDLGLEWVYNAKTSNGSVFVIIDKVTFSMTLLILIFCEHKSGKFNVGLYTAVRTAMSALCCRDKSCVVFET